MGLSGLGFRVTVQGFRVWGFGSSKIAARNLRNPFGSHGTNSTVRETPIQLRRTPGRLTDLMIRKGLGFRVYLLPTKPTLFQELYIYIYI